MAAADRKLNVGLLFGCWALTAAIFVLRAWLSAGTVPLLLDADDAMRLTMVHDFLAGQGWYDLVQHRLNTPFGGAIHWSRLIDLPEAALLLLLRPVAGAAADTLAAYVWPLGLLLALLYLSARTALRLAGPAAQLPALLLPAFSLITMAEFAPGRFDHHSAQILLGFVMLYCTIEALGRPRFAIGAGLAASGALAIGIEGLPMLVATVLSFGLAWAISAGQARALRLFGLSLGLSALGQLLIGVPPERWFAPACDAISIVYVAAAIMTGLAFVLLSWLRIARWQVRLALGLAAGAVVASLSLWLFPECLKGPYGALDPWLVANWIDRISEAQPWLVSLARDPVAPLAEAVPPCLALGVIVWRLLRGDKADRGAWLVYLGFLAIAIATMLYEIRAARCATSLAFPACAWLIVKARQRYIGEAREGKSPLAAIGLLLASWIGSAGFAVGVVAGLGLLAVPGYAAATADTGKPGRQACLLPAAFAALAALPPARIMAPIDLGSHLLLFTPHSVVAAPYHRNWEAPLDAFRFFNQPLDEARLVLERRGITLVVICPAMPEITGMVAHAPDSFVTLYAENALPGWLVPEPLPGTPLKLYRVVPR